MSPILFVVIFSLKTIKFCRGYSESFTKRPMARTEGSSIAEQIESTGKQGYSGTFGLAVFLEPAQSVEIAGQGKASELS